MDKDPRTTDEPTAGRLPVRESVFEKTKIPIYLDVLYFRWLPTKNSNIIN